MSDVFLKALGKDDAEFARSLSRNGYGDLAELVLGAMDKAGGGKGASDGSMLRLELEQDRIRREPDLGKRIGLLEAFIDQRDEIVRKSPSSPEAAEILEGQPGLYLDMGELMSELLSAKEPPPEPDKLRKKGEQMLQQAVDLLEKRVEALGQPEEGLDEAQQEERTVKRMVASYALARTHYFRALLQSDTFSRNTIAKKALDILRNFQLDYPDQLLTYEGFIYEGLCHQAMEQNDKALESFDAAIALRETYEKTRAGVYQMAHEAADIVSAGVQQKMLLQSKSGDAKGAAETAADFFASTQDAASTHKGLAVLSLQADAFQQLGDQAALLKVAKTLIEADPNGPGGQRGRELLGGGGGSGSGGKLSAADVLRLANSTAAREPDKAIEQCQRVLWLVHGNPDAAATGCSAGLLLGTLYAQKQLMHEAVVAWEGTAQRFPDAADAPECLWRAINGYLVLQSAEKRPFYKTLSDGLMSELSKRYPKHQYASMAGLIEGQQAEAEGDFVRAAQIYERVAPGTAGHEEGMYRAGNAWSKQARKLFAEKSPDAMQAVKRSEDLLVKARTALDEAATKTLETTDQDRFRAFSFSARVAQANLYLIEGVNRAAEVAPLFLGMDQKLAGDPARMSMVWDLRFRALRAQNKLDEAMALLDAQVRLDPTATWLEGAASAIAPVLDKRGQDAFASDPKSSDGERLWSKAATYYQLALKPQLEGRAAVQVDQLEGVADRLFVFGLRQEGVPDSAQTFADWNGKRLTSELLEVAARAYEKCVPLTPSRRTAIKLARTLGFLGRYDEAAARYAELFERENFVDRISNTIITSEVAAKPELLYAYSEWGVAELEVGKDTNDKTKLLRASKIFEALVLGNKEASKLWWQAKFYQVEAMMDLGKYEVADVTFNSLLISYPHYDGGEFGFQRRFEELKNELSKKVFGQPPPPTPPKKP